MWTCPSNTCRANIGKPHCHLMRCFGVQSQDLNQEHLNPPAWIPVHHVCYFPYLCIITSRTLQYWVINHQSSLSILLSELLSVRRSADSYWRMLSSCSMVRPSVSLAMCVQCCIQLPAAIYPMYPLVAKYHPGRASGFLQFFFFSAGF